jgi:hypothetical protein
LSARPRTSPPSPDRMSDPRSHQHVGSGGISERRRWSAAVSKNRIHVPSVRRVAQPLHRGPASTRGPPDRAADRTDARPAGTTEGSPGGVEGWGPRTVSQGTARPTSSAMAATMPEASDDRWSLARPTRGGDGGRSDPVRIVMQRRSPGPSRGASRPSGAAGRLPRGGRPVRTAPGDAAPGGWTRPLRPWFHVEPLEGPRTRACARVLGLRSLRVQSRSMMTRRAGSRPWLRLETPS